jgi:hypothetical protein
MKKLVILIVSLCVAVPALAQGTKGNGAPKGKFEKFLLVAPGNPNITSEDFLKNDTSNGRAIFIPVKTANPPKAEYCGAVDGNGFYFKNDEANANLGDVEPRDGVKLNFTKDPALSSLQIVDRDATDGYAEIAVPADWAEATSIELWIRVLGKPGGCLGMDAYVYDGATYFYAGTAVFKRKAGQSTYQDVSDLANVWYCPDGSYVQTGTNTYDCIDANGAVVDAVELNVFNNAFEAYFWDINNAGVRVAQVLMRANFPK